MTDARIWVCSWAKLFEPQHEKNNKVNVCLAKTQISLGIRPVWSKSSLCASWVAKGPRFLHADSEDSDLSLRWANTYFVGFVMSRLISFHHAFNIYKEKKILFWLMPATKS